MVLMGRARHIGLFGSPSAEDYRIARKYLAMMKVADLEHRAFNELSGGQRQLVMIAQALSSECEIMILDEPCSSLDYRNQSIVIEMLRTLNAEMGLTIVFTTHAPQHGLEIATDVLLMKDLRHLPSRPHARRADRREPERPLWRADRQGRVCQRQVHLRTALRALSLESPMKKIAYVTWGSASQLTSFQDFSGYLDDMLYLRELERHDLSRYAAVVLPDGMDRAGIRRYAGQLNDYVRGGGFLIVFACAGRARMDRRGRARLEAVDIDATGSGGPSPSPISRSTSPSRSIPSATSSR